LNTLEATRRFSHDIDVRYGRLFVKPSIILVMLKSLYNYNYFGDVMGTVTVKVDEKLKKMMGRVKINWSEYIREAIRRRVELEERKAAAERLLEELKSGRHVVPEGFINRTLRESREAR